MSIAWEPIMLYTRAYWRPAQVIMVNWLACINVFIFIYVTLRSDCKWKLSTSMERLPRQKKPKGCWHWSSIGNFNSSILFQSIESPFKRWTNRVSLATCFGSLQWKLHQTTHKAYHRLNNMNTQINNEIYF